ncbi:hypothetical protein K458DRAFT_287346 [Lentithecium fluviatile CBS 122367]|uniref:DUF7905 domain-containing protein n=1 Tax=Lentithecium fluviatile CBS 122367 TaxID=1168545 RepID=A0A6G1JL51_9PLEO|nr:hypothetical protein K458DRAFT_287346 [Lentithecium fluviatile CBS 122367]
MLSSHNAQPGGQSTGQPGNQNKFIGRKPSRTVNVPSEYIRDTTIREKERVVDELKLETGCDVLPRTDHKKRITRFEIYSAGSGVDNAVVKVNEWIVKASTKSKESSAWAKLPAFFHDKWYDNAVREAEKARRARFKEPIPEGTVVSWPEDLRDYDPPQTPRVVFGPKLERLDFIRIEHEVFITPYSDAPFWEIRIQGFSMEHVDSAEDHYQSMIQKIRTKLFGPSRALNIILDETEGIEVYLDEVPKWWPNRIDKIAPRLEWHPMMNEAGDFRKERMHPAQLSVIQHAIQLALEAIKYKKGYYDFNIRFGCLVLSSAKMPDSEIGKTYSKAAFLASIDSRVDCYAKKWAMNNDDGMCLLDKLITADHFLEPVKSAGFFGHTPSTLAETSPLFRGTWVFRDPNAPRFVQPQSSTSHAGPPPPSLVVVQIDWTDDEGGQHEKMEPRFFQLKPGHGGPKENMDIKLLELGEAKAWQFSLESMVPLSKKIVSPALRGFAEQVKMRPKYSKHSNETFATWKWSPSLKIEAGRLDKIYSFGIRNTCYKVEAIAMWYPGQKVPCWGINVRHSEWVSHLADLEQLQLGRCAEWGDVIKTFLPDDGLISISTQEKEDDLPDVGKVSLSLNVMSPAREGIRILANKLMELSEIINNPVGGITIGGPGAGADNLLD